MAVTEARHCRMVCTLHKWHQQLLQLPWRAGGSQQGSRCRRSPRQSRALRREPSAARGPAPLSPWPPCTSRCCSQDSALGWAVPPTHPRRLSPAVLHLGSAPGKGTRRLWLRPALPHAPVGHRREELPRDAWFWCVIHPDPSSTPQRFPGIHVPAHTHRTPVPCLPRPLQLRALTGALGLNSPSSQAFGCY